MSDQIVVFKNGERVIGEMSEVFNGEGEDRKGVCLLIKNPYILELVSSNDPNSAMDLQVKFSKWCPYSVDYQFRIPYDSVLAIGEPDQGLDQAYQDKIATLVAQQKAQEKAASEAVPKWEEGQTNPNMEAQLAEIAEVTGTDAPTAGVAGETAKHPIAEPLAQEDAETAEV